ncbi:MAG TPA: UDP-N-acetylmuramoyl-L-alanyl-D-glutamate--2,6-diaminopimelate ligase [Polyangiaceae bacterium]|nr:UDP-N-acetylmuramoyl-L-alanyl-D-glutamate--2,6-diaminopimelate ligase [Polyangiaceae bacterium]
MTGAMAAAPSSGMSVQQLAQVLAPLHAQVIGDGSVTVNDVSQDSRQIGTGFAFMARSGASVNGTQFAQAAIAAGATALISSDPNAAQGLGVPLIVVDHERKALALAAEALHGNPSQAVKVIGVTGTNGKTTVAVLTEFALGVCGAKPARLGTLGFSFGAQLQPSNLTQDHLDFHGDLHSYGEAKARLFRELHPRASVIHTKDKFGQLLAAELPDAIRVGTAFDCAVRPVTVTVDRSGISGKVQLPSGQAQLSSPLIGQHNLENILVVLGIVSAAGFDARQVAPAFADAPAVPGRFERCDGPGDAITVLVDYAHTPDALIRVLQALKGLGTGRLICVFGCGGDRDPVKRPLMGEAAGQLADHVIVTNDNPRSEDPARIAAAVMEGVRRTTVSYEQILDRAQAIEQAIRTAQPKDCVLLAGKGHEDYQIIGNQKHHFDDREVARAALARRRGEKVSG